MATAVTLAIWEPTSKIAYFLHGTRCAPQNDWAVMLEV